MSVFCINCILLCIPVITSNIIIAFGFSNKNPKITKFRCVIELTLLQAPIGIAKMLLNHNIGLRNIFILTNITLLILYAHKRFIGQLWKKVVFILFYYLCNYIAEIIVQLLMEDELSIAFRENPYSTVTVTFFLIYLFILSTFFFLLFLYIWRKIGTTERYTFKSFVVFVIFPASQLLMIASMSSGIFEFDTPRGMLALSGIMIGLVADILLLYTLFRQQSMHEMSIRLHSIQKAWDVEQNHYEEIEARREELAKIRHDLNEQFYVIDELISTNNIDKAQQMLHTLREYVDSTKEYVYCGDPVVNAILEENQRFCDEKNIELTYDLQIPKPLLIEPVSTCSLFSNLLRNAIAAASDVTVKRPCISIKATVNGDYLHVRVDNDYVKTTKRLSKESRKGYGLDILQSIADKYNGQMETECTDSQYSVRIFIENVER